MLPEDVAHPLAQVLYVEDQPALAAVVLLELEQAHISVTTVPSGEQCLALARERKFDLILLDQLLPKMDGIEICRRLKGEPGLREIPVIFFTAFPSRYHEDEARRLGAADYLLKGFPEPRLAARILSEVELAKARNAPAKLEPKPEGSGPTSWLKGLLKRI